MLNMHWVLFYKRIQKRIHFIYRYIFLISGDDIKPYLDQLITHLLTMLRTSTLVHTKELVVSAIGAVGMKNFIFIIKVTFTQMQTHITLYSCYIIISCCSCYFDFSKCCERELTSILGTNIISTSRMSPKIFAAEWNGTRSRKYEPAFHANFG